MALAYVFSRTAHQMPGNRRAYLPICLMSTTAIFILSRFPQLLSAVSPLSVVSNFKVISLHGQWEFHNSNKSVNGTGTVPGDIFTDLHRLGHIPAPLFGDNHLHFGWIASEDWTYSKGFEVDRSILKFGTLLLRLKGIDTIASVVLNGKLLLKTSNQFVEYVVNISGVLAKHNLIAVHFSSPVSYAAKKSEEYEKSYGHLVPPVCPPTIFNGECHPNFIRKAQYSFSWDWGPSFPTVGIWKPIDIVAFNGYFVDDISWTTERTADFWIVHGETIAYVGSKATKIELVVEIEELGVSQFFTFSVKKQKAKAKRLKFDIKIPYMKVKLWWPNGEGQQKLYTIKLIAEDREISRRLGFRHVELIQDYVDIQQKDKGRHFYFKVNDRPIFLKGSNWIPISMFLSIDHSQRLEFLLDSTAEAGMNAVRVWGGGVYESDEFYNLADEKGILIWQVYSNDVMPVKDLMFACALYPIDAKFLNSVKIEVKQQVWRIRRHPSVLLWAGNNENEVAIRSYWWGVANYTEDQQAKDYVMLYSDTIKPLVKTGDPSRPFLLSSPSNGVRTEEEGGISVKPDDPRYGDIHFYDEAANLWRDASYRTPRCATEYGVQSIPFASTMLKHINSSEWAYMSGQMTRRQHHPLGVVNNLIMVFTHFPIPFQCPKSVAKIDDCVYVRSPAFVDRFAYYSQAHQAIAYKTQTEHYRRMRNILLPSGLGNTMCALYWQLNDVWAAPTWSSIDINLNWKMVHYEARRFMTPLVVVLYSVGVNDMGITVVNDSPMKITDAKVVVDTLAWSNGFDPVHSSEKSVKIEPLSAKDIYLEHSSKLRVSDADLLIRARLINSSGTSITPETVLLPEKLYEVDFETFGDVSISDFEKIDSSNYRLTINATGISPFTWISVNKSFLGWFTNNAFTMTRPTYHIRLILKEPLDLTLNDFKVCNLKNCGML